MRDTSNDLYKKEFLRRSSSKYAEKLKKVFFIGSYVPRRCGIATFTSDLLEALSAEAQNTEFWAIAVNDVQSGYDYPYRVRFEIDQNRLSDYKLASEFLNMNQIDIVCLQHEYGLFGGPAGSHIISLLKNLRMPVVVTLHTILKDPDPTQKEVMIELSKLCDRMVVMSRKGEEFLKEIYKIESDKISFAHHGIPDVPFVDPNFYKDQFGVEGKKVILTFGLISPNKGIEYMIEALPYIVKNHKDVVYIVLGATHPHLKRERGEEYRIGLQELARRLGVSDHIIFQNRFVDLDELLEFLGAADIYVTPYVNEAQIVSGTLTYAMGAGKATVSTPYWYAAEMLSDGRGCLVPFKDPLALADAINELLEDDRKRNAIRKKAYLFCREAIWKEVARKYLEIFSEVKSEREKSPRPFFSPRISKYPVEEFPELRPDHMKRMTDDTGMLQHACFSTPDRNHGYCTDDNARALIVTTLASQILPEDKAISDLSDRYLSFLYYAFNKELKRFRNFMTYDRRWLEDKGSEDAHARAIWGLGTVVGYSKRESQILFAATLFDQSVKTVEEFKYPRAWAYSILGITSYLRKFKGSREARRILEVLGKKLLAMFKENWEDGWLWLEDRLTYANGRLPHALINCGHMIQNDEMIEAGLRSLEWLASVQIIDGRFCPIGNKGWYKKGKIRARFDQQPIEAKCMIEACIEAYNITRDTKWVDRAGLCFSWFLGRNDLNIPLYDYTTCGCRDGLMPSGVNENQGAESTLCWLLSVVAMHKLQTHRLLRLKNI